MRTEPAEFEYPEHGAKKSAVFRDCGIANYSYYGTYKNKYDEYIGDVLYLGQTSRILLCFDKNNTFYSAAIFTPLSYSTWLDGLKDVFGYDYELDLDDDGNLRYTWTVGYFYYSLTYQYDSKVLYTFIAF